MTFDEYAGDLLSGMNPVARARYEERYMTKKKSEDVVKELAAEEARNYGSSDKPMTKAERDTLFVNDVSLSPLGQAAVEVARDHSRAAMVSAASQDAVVDNCIVTLRKQAAILGGVGHFETNGAAKLVADAVVLLEQCQETDIP